MKPLWPAALIALMVVGAAGAGSAPDFQRDVRPILARHCFKCHGPDEHTRESGLRLDVREDALKPARSGERALVPGRPDASELLRRVLATDPDDRMPPPAEKRALSAEEKDTLRRWIAAGAEYAPHWAFVPPRQAPLPAVKEKAWPQNEIDHFVLARLEHEGLQPAPPADDYTLVRRLYLDLIGLPPTPEEAEAFIRDVARNRRIAIERLVDSLLASPHYGERWARRWLDLARYADTNGYEKDRPRSIWPWRDWVINALNADMPFDEFTIRQLAGDLLPGATPDDLVATGFHRNTMLNEEGGIDPLEFRYHAMTDRVAVTGTTWLGLTTGCAQCHTHKYDPITHREYFQFMAFLNNADEPEIDLPDAKIAARRREMQARIDALLEALPEKFPVEELRWDTPRPAQAQAERARPTILDDGSVLLTGEAPDTDTFTITLETAAPRIDVLRLEALTDDSLPRQGPGRSSSGNFVLSEVTVLAAPRNDPAAVRTVKLDGAEADFAQERFPVKNAIDGDPQTGWAIANPGKEMNVNRTATFRLAEPLALPGGARLVVRLEHTHGKQLTLGRLRLSVGTRITDDRPVEVRRRERFEQAFTAWLARERARTVAWQPLRPAAATSNLPLLTVQDDDSVFVSGDTTKSDTYELKFRNEVRGIVAVRLEALPDERLPAHGPGMTFYEGRKGDFFMGEFQLRADGQPVQFAHAEESYAKNTFGNNPVNAALAIDGDTQTGWSCSGRYGERHVAVFHLAARLAGARELDLTMIFGRHFASSLGRFRVSVSTDPAAAARDLPAAVEHLLAQPENAWTSDQRTLLRRQFALVAPELADARAEIDKLREAMPEFPTTLVFRERPPENPRPTFLHHRGEFLQPKDEVEPVVLSVLHDLPGGAPGNRLGFAQWLVSPDNPLVGRVTVNRQWHALFGRGLVPTIADFGLQGESPSHPELLDWLAVEFVKRGWSLKQLHRQIVLSATYQQASRVTPELLARDPENRLLARGPRVRLEAELIRDSALRIAGLLAPKVGGPSVFPPQPSNVTTEGAYGKLPWQVSEGADKYRRGLYTYMKRTAPYAMFTTFDAPSGEACVAQRDVSDTPLQALTLLNDTVFVDMSQALGRMMAARAGTIEERVDHLFRRFVTRPPAPEERTSLVRFLETQRQRFASGELDAAQIAGEGAGDVNERAAWTALARALFNLDETITKG